MITMDGRAYNVRIRIKTLDRAFRVEDSERSGQVKSGRYFRDIIGTFYDYAMEVEPVPGAPDEYDAFYDAISAPVESHTLTVPYGQETLTYEAMVTSGKDTQRDKVGGVTCWMGLKVNFTAMEPQRRPT